MDLYFKCFGAVIVFVLTFIATAEFLRFLSRNFIACWLYQEGYMIPPRKPVDQLKDKDVRWYVHTKSSVKQAMTDEAFRRGVDLWTLGGAVLASWLQAGCPDFPVGTSELPIPAPSPSSSIAGPKEPEA